MGKGKQRNRKTICPQDYEDFDDSADDKPDVDSPTPIRPPKPQGYTPQSNLPFKEGDVVTFRGITGTVFMTVGQEYHVMDVTGIIHTAYVSEVTPVHVRAKQ